MEAGEATRTGPSRAGREDFKATSDPALQESADRGKPQAPRLRRALQPLGAPAVGDPGPRLQPGQGRLARAHPRGGALPAPLRPLELLHRRAEGRRRARPDHARRADRDPADLPRPPRSPTRPATSASSTASSARSACSTSTAELQAAPRRARAAPEPGVRRALRRPAEAAGRPPRRRARGLRGAGRGDDALPHGHRGDARPDGPALHHRLQRAEGTLPGLRRGLLERRPRRAPPHRLRRPLPGRRGPREGLATATVIQRMLEEAIPVADRVIDPPWAEEEDMRALRRHAARRSTRSRRSASRAASR